MFGRVLILFVAAAIALSTAACAFADFADLRLIRVYYDRNGTEVATDLGDIHTLVQTAESGGSTTLGGSFTGLTANATTFAVYFALDRTTGVSDLWATGKVGVNHTINGMATGLTSLKSGSSSTYALYNANATNGGTEYTGPASATSSFKNKLSPTQGWLGNSINAASRLNTEASLAGVIGSGTGTAVQALYFWENALTTVAAEKIGVQVATITTNADGSTVISPPPAPATVPAAPTIGTATVTGDGKVSVTFTPGSDGGSPIIGNGYKVTSYPGSITGTGSASPITVLGLINGTSYNFTVTATNSVGASDPSEASNSVTPTVPQAIDAVTFSPATLAAGGSTTASATATSGLTVSFSSQTPEICSVTGTTVTGIKVGTCTVAANQTGGSGFDPAPQVLQDITVAQGSQTIGAITFTPATLAVGGGATASATGGGSGNPVAFSSTTPEVCSVDGATVTGIRAGSCTIAANQAGNADYEDATQATQDIEVAKGAQTIGAIGFSPATLAVGGATTASATGGASGNPVTFGSATPEVCGVNGATVTALTTGTCSITTNQAGSADYEAAPQTTQEIEVAKGAQTIGAIGFSPATLAVGGATTASATGGASGNPVTFGSATPEVCSVDGATVTGLKAGTCTIAASQAGNSSYNPAPQVTPNIAVAKGAQSIVSFSFTPNEVNVGDSTTASATASSGLAVGFGSETPEVCGVTGNSVTILTSGTCTVTAFQPGNDDYLPASGQMSISAGMAGQAITFDAAPSLTVGGSATVSATGGASGNPVTFSSSTPAVCSVSGSTVTGLKTGSCSIDANQAGNSNYNPATRTTQNIEVAKGAQSIGAIGFSPATLAVGGATTASAAGGASGNPVTFGSATPDICSVSGSTVTALAAGTCTVSANQAGSDDYEAAAQVTRDIAVGKGVQSIGVIGFSPATLSVGGATTASATGGGAGNPVTFGSATPEVCSVDGATVTGIKAGTCSITANQAGSADYEDAAQVTQNIAVAKGAQNIGAIGFSPATLAVVGATTVSATGGASGNPVTFDSATPEVCTVSGTTVTGLKAGTCTVAANQAGSADYEDAAQVTLEIAVGKGVQSIGAIGFSPATLAVGSATTASATGGASGNPVTFGSATPAVCSVSGTTVTGLKTGTCTVAANQAGSADYNPAAQVTQNIAVAKGAQSIVSFSFTPNEVNVGDSTTANAAASSGLTVGFSSDTPEVCGVTGNSVTILNSGTCTIRANQPGDDDYLPTSEQLNISAGLAGQVITFDAAPSLTVGGSAAVSATGGGSGNPVAFGSATPEVCSVDGSAVTALAAGSCTIAANQAGNSNYNPATQVTQSITIGKGAQSIGAIGFSPATLAVGGITTAGAAGGASGNPVTYGSATPDVCSVDGATVTALTAGACSIAASQAGNADYEAATQMTQSIAIGKGEQSIESFAFSTNTVKVGDSTTVSATATSGLPVTFNSATPDVCSLTGNTVTFLTTGMCIITAMQPGGDDYHAAGGMLSITAERAGQTITFGAPPTLLVGQSAPLSATGGASGNPVSFSSATPEVCSVSDSTVSALAAGTCTIAAEQAGNDNYEAATQVAQNITVTKATQSIGAISFSPETLAINGTTTASGSASSGLAVVFASVTPEVCSVSGSTVTGLSVGNCTIKADQPGNEAYGAAPQRNQLIAVSATVPEAPGAVTGTSGNGSAVVSFTEPAFNGGSAILGYTITSSPGGFSATGSASPITVTGLANGTAYTFTVTAANAIGLGPQSLPSAGVTPATLPGAPNIGTATATDARATVVFTAPAFDGGSAITGYTVTSHPAGGVDIDAGSGSLTHAVTGLVNGTSYTFTVTAANAVGSGSVSAHSNGVTPATVPGAPVIDNVAAGNATAVVTFSAPASTGGSAVTSYTVTAAPGGMTATGNDSPLTVTGLANGTAYTFTVTATNAVGSGLPSPPSAGVTPATVPGAPSAVSVTAGDAQATVTFTAPSSDGGSAITEYTVTASPGGLTGTGTSGPITVTGLDNGTAYTFTVTATNATGTGTISAASNRVTPALPLAIFAVTPAAGSNGAIAPATVQSASVGSSISFTVTPAAGYQIAAVSGCGGTLSDSTFTTGALTGDCQVSATFVALPALKGDLNGNDKIDLPDALLALQFAVGMRTPGADDLAAGDVAPFVNNASAPDRKLDVADAVAILRRSVDLLSW